MQLITDRSEADVLLGTEKGYYGSSDLNRVETFVEDLLRKLPELDVRILLKTKRDWTLTDAFSPDTWPVKSQMARYLENVRALCESLDLYPEIPRSMERLDYVGANQIEQALLLAERRIAAVKNTYRFSGELIAGEE